ncbi:hypothetical protein K2X85_08815 [bacterium]|nr:hypothetical protein [bacterium]
MEIGLDAKQMSRSVTIEGKQVNPTCSFRDFVQLTLLARFNAARRCDLAAEAMNPAGTILGRFMGTAPASATKIICS